ncbi:MAG: hypothetical protein E6J91_23955 [Deltaproteobacteria bacterium]|nr:MAG: hypothetical protein E6J91_23955 [Deltaproteobacteria bacterium]
MQIEELVAPPTPDAVIVPHGTPPPSIPKMLYFCVPPNDKLLGYWDTVADRLAKIRSCRNIEGIVRQLPLFEPPIDPLLLVKAAAAGVDLSTAVADLALPHYRFQTMAQHAVELAGEVKALGQALLQALEKRDAEDLALLRATQEQAMHALVKKVKQRQYADAVQSTTSLRASRASAVAKYVNYQRLLGVASPGVPAEGAAVPDVAPSAPVSISQEDGVKLTQYEAQELARAKSAADDAGTASDWEFIAGLLNLIPNFSVNIEPWGIGASISFGGSNIGAALTAVANRYRTTSARATFDSSRAARLGAFALREGDWALQSNLAAKEIMQIDQQLIGSAIREQIAQQELDNQDAQIEQSAALHEFMTGKYTNRELYDWMVGQVAALYFQTYQLAYDVAKRSERCFRNELAADDASFVQFGYWDSLRKGLLCGERLYQDLKQMQLAYVDQNRREFEIAKSVSLAALHPEALVDLQEGGSCIFELPEAVFDLDHPGHYLRRLRAVTLTIPCVAGPYTSVSAKLTLLGSRTRRDTRTTPSYALQPSDTRFSYNVGGIQSVVTSTGRDDSGLFELSFRDERYLPFEGAGAISTWRLELPAEFRQFDYRTISDVIVRLRYTARDGGDALKAAALGQLDAALKAMEVQDGRTGLYHYISARQDHYDDWYRFLHPPENQTADQVLALELARDQFPAALRDRGIKIDAMILFVRPAKGVAYSDSDHLFITIAPPSPAAAVPVELVAVATEMGGVPFGAPSFGAGVAVTASGSTATWRFDVTQIPAALRTTVMVDGAPVDRLDPDKVVDLGIICHFKYG